MADNNNLTSFVKGLCRGTITLCPDVWRCGCLCSYVLIKIDLLYIAERPKKEYFSDSYLICCRGAAKVRQMLRVEQGRGLYRAIPAVTFAWYGIYGPPYLFAFCDKHVYSDARLSSLEIDKQTLYRWCVESKRELID